MTIKWLKNTIKMYRIRLQICRKWSASYKVLFVLWTFLLSCILYFCTLDVLAVLYIVFLYTGCTCCPVYCIFVLWMYLLYCILFFLYTECTCCSVYCIFVLWTYLRSCLLYFCTLDVLTVLYIVFFVLWTYLLSCLLYLNISNWLTSWSSSRPIFSWNQNNVLL